MRMVCSFSNYFLKFDRAQSRFLSRARFYKAMQLTGITVVPKLPTPAPVSVESLQKLVVETKSSFSSNAIEGCVIRLDHGDYLTDRVKIVRPDFIAGNRHWGKGPLEVNLLERSQQLGTSGILGF